ncbi:voltage-dependent anion channel [Dactylonectria macrodidyma]|uniref:Voltage-dependent anion channel n=1 Tax=Dactylonectria macrodidyma TaxID=307937 RepID=A0A9P9DFZ9_9HYPO|nr:voltage-dependent anion channel [Dactylonectria macrodidyma]
MPISTLRMAIRNVTTQWFLIPQGTGILSVILHQLDYQFDGLQTISIIFWFICIVTLCLFLLLYLTRLIFYPKEAFHAIATNTIEAACLSSISISFTSIIQMLSLVVIQNWGGHGWTTAVYVLWWINMGMAVAASFCIPILFIRSTTVQGGFEQAFTPAAQLPLIAALTSAAGAGTLCQSALLSNRQEVPMIIVGYLEIGVGIPMALALDTLFWGRHFLPRQSPDLNLPRDFAMQGLGKAILQGAFANYRNQMGVLWTSAAATTIGYGSIFFGLLSWATSLFWWFFATAGIVHALLSRAEGPGLPFSLSTWTIVFPWGVYTNAAVELGKLLDAHVFRVWSTILAVTLVVFWLTLTALTLKGILQGHLLGLDHGWKIRRAPHG